MDKKKVADFLEEIKEHYNTVDGIPLSDDTLKKLKEAENAEVKWIGADNESEGD